MTTAPKPDSPIPVICIDPASVAGAEIFNPNSWSGQSKGIIQSCWTEYSVLHHCVDQISDICNGADRLCAKHVETIQQQWHARKFDLERVVIYGQHPDLHIQIEALFSGVKTLLDLLVQLLSTEHIVSGVVDGFHRKQKIYGGRVLAVLRNNAKKEKMDAGAKLEVVISEHKGLWIDQMIAARDLLIHPKKGMHQLMFSLEFVETVNALAYVKAHPPEIYSKPMHLYAQDILKYATVFSMSFLEQLRDPKVSHNARNLHGTMRQSQTLGGDRLTPERKHE